MTRFSTICSALSLSVLILVGCGDGGGYEPCELQSQCGGSDVCLTGPTLHHGMCVGTCASNADCGSADCYLGEEDAVGFCAQSCLSDVDCSSDMGCADVGSFDGIGMCVPTLWLE